MHSYSYISEIIIEITVIYLLSGPLCINEYLIGCLYERAHFPNYNVQCYKEYMNYNPLVRN